MDKYKQSNTVHIQAGKAQELEVLKEVVSMFGKPLTVQEHINFYKLWGDILEEEINYDPVNKPKHYNNHPSGVECILLTRHMSFNVGNAFKYVFRAEQKNNALEDYKKALWYIENEIDRLQRITPTYDIPTDLFPDLVFNLGKIVGAETKNSMERAEMLFAIGRAGLFIDIFGGLSKASALLKDIIEELNK